MHSALHWCKTAEARVQLWIQTLNSAVLLPNIPMPLEIAWDTQITHRELIDRDRTHLQVTWTSLRHKKEPGGRRLDISPDIHTWVTEPCPNSPLLHWQEKQPSSLVYRDFYLDIQNQVSDFKGQLVWLQCSMVFTAQFWWLGACLCQRLSELQSRVSQGMNYRCTRWFVNIFVFV